MGEGELSNTSYTAVFGSDRESDRFACQITELEGNVCNERG